MTLVRSFIFFSGRYTKQITSVFLIFYKTLIELGRFSKLWIWLNLDLPMALPTYKKDALIFSDIQTKLLSILNILGNFQWIWKTFNIVQFGQNRPRDQRGMVFIFPGVHIGSPPSLFRDWSSRFYFFPRGVEKKNRLKSWKILKF